MKQSRRERHAWYWRILVGFIVVWWPVAVSLGQININLKKAKLETVLKKIEAQSGFRFFYADELGSLHIGDMKVKNMPLATLMDKISEAADINYQIRNNVIFLTRRPHEKPKAQAQQEEEKPKRVVEGMVTDEQAKPVVGATVRLLGTHEGAISDAAGRFRIVSDEGTEVQVSYVGYRTTKAPVKRHMTVQLEQVSEDLNSVVVTALGIRRKERTLSYQVQSVSGEQVNRVSTANFMKAMEGKAAGLTINASAVGIGGATKVTMRGPKSINQSNLPLYVVDGVPITNTSHGEVGEQGIYSNQPGTEGIADLNSEDIEDVSILTGPAAAALYGSAAAQGVIMIMTKKGREGGVRISLSNHSQFCAPLVLPKFQSMYANRDGEFQSWGGKGTVYHHFFDPSDFFDTGTNIQNNASLTTGSEHFQTYLSFGTTNARGIIPNNRFDRYNFSFRNTATFLKKKLSADIGFNIMRGYDRNFMAQGQYFNPLPAVYLFPRGEDFRKLRNFETYDEERRIGVQNWSYGNNLKMQNPYWMAYRVTHEDLRTRYMVSATLSYKLLPWLDLTGRMRWDDARTKQENKRYASTIFFAHSDYGFYGYDNVTDQTLYVDFMANATRRWGDLALQVNAGASTTKTSYGAEGFMGGLKAPSNIFTPNAIDYTKGDNDNRPIFNGKKHAINSLLASGELGWRERLFLTLTWRNDWDSALDGTNHESFFYPSVGLSAIVSDMVRLPKWLPFMKLRASWASVGSAISPNITSAWRYGYNAGTGSYSTFTYRLPDTFYPERTDSWEGGVTARFFDNRLQLDMTFYQSNTRKQTFLRKITSASGYDYEYVQTGNVRNRGLELTLKYHRQWQKADWTTQVTYSMNRNKIIDLLEDPRETITKGGLNGADIILKKGGTMGDVYIRNDFLRTQTGKIVVDGQYNVRQTNLAEPMYKGSVLPKANIGFSNDFSWHGIQLGVLLTARLGGICMSQTQAFLDSYGVSEASAKARQNGGVTAGGVKVTTENYYGVVGGESPIWSEYIYKATNVRLQELNVGYNIPPRWLGGMRLYVGLTARNLWLIYNQAPFDPESVASTGTYYQGFDYFMQPSMRALGFHIKLNF